MQAMDDLFRQDNPELVSEFAHFEFDHGSPPVCVITIVITIKDAGKRKSPDRPQRQILEVVLPARICARGQGLSGLHKCLDDCLAVDRGRFDVLDVAARIALVSAAAGIVIGLACDSFLGTVLAHRMQNSFTAGSLFAAAALLALSALLACLFPPATPAPSRPPKLSAMNKACLI
jgi:hypothetical protein